MRRFLIYLVCTYSYVVAHAQSDTLPINRSIIDMKNNTSTTDSNKAFLKMLIENRLPLTNYPERVTENLMVYLSAPLPFAGKYVGLKEYYSLVPQMIAYYDYSKFKLLGVYADENIVFVTIQIGLNHSEKNLVLCEQFTFEKERIKEIKTFIFY